MPKQQGLSTLSGLDLRFAVEAEGKDSVYIIICETKSTEGFSSPRKKKPSKTIRVETVLY